MRQRTSEMEFPPAHIGAMVTFLAICMFVILSQYTLEWSGERMKRYNGCMNVYMKHVNMPWLFTLIDFMFIEWHKILRLSHSGYSFSPIERYICCNLTIKVLTWFIFFTYFLLSQIPAILTAVCALYIHCKCF